MGFPLFTKGIESTCCVEPALAISNRNTVTGRAFLVYGGHQRLGVGPPAAARFRSPLVRDGLLGLFWPQIEAQ